VPSDDLRGDALRRRFEALETEVLPLADSPAAEAIRRRGRRRQRTLRMAVLVSAVLLGVAVTRGVELWSPAGLSPASPGPTTLVASPTSAPPVTPSVAPPPVASPTTRQRARTTAPPVTEVDASRAPVLGPDGLAVAAFGVAEQAALAALERQLGPPDERGSWDAASPFGTCPGPVRAVRWGRLYVLFTSGPTRYEDRGRWHLFAYQVDAIRRTAIDPNDTGPTPPDPPPLRGPSPRTAAGIGFGSTLAELRAAYGQRVQVSYGEPGMVHRFRVRLGAAGELSGSLSGSTPAATVTGIAAGARCGE
jgi:hypothetical protein